MRPWHGIGLVGLLLASGCAAPADDDAASAEEAARIAKKTGAYTAEIHVTSEGGRALDVIHAVQGWLCDARASARYRETENDHRGQPVSHFHEGKGAYSFSTVIGRPSVTMSFTRDFQRTDPAVAIAFDSTCSKIETTTCMKQDAQGNTYQSTCTEHKLATFAWRCEVTDLPSREGEATEKVCSSVPTSVAATSGGSDVQMLAAFSRAQIRAKVRLDELRETYDFDNCPSNLAGQDRFYLRITQGLGGAAGEDDFALHVKLDDTTLPPIASRTGLFSQTISFCRPASANERLRVHLEGVEEDLVWDDLYTPVAEDSNVELTPGTRRELRLMRKGAFGILPASESRVVVELFAEE